MIFFMIFYEFTMMEFMIFLNPKKILGFVYDSIYVVLMKCFMLFVLTVCIFCFMIF